MEKPSGRPDSEVLLLQAIKDSGIYNEEPFKSMTEDELIQYVMKMFGCAKWDKNSK